MNNLHLTRQPYIRDLRTGIIEEGHFLLKRIHINTGKKNRPYLRLLLADKTGHMSAVYFASEKDIHDIQKNLKAGDIVKINGIIEEFNETVQINLIKIGPSEREDWDLSRFYRRTPHDRRELYRNLKDYLLKIQNKDLQQLCMNFLKDRVFMRLFLEAPASRMIHHAYIGGLLEHTLHVVELVYAYARIYDDADRDLLISGAFIHDIGKVDEYRFLISEIDYSDAGKLKGHTLLGYERLKPALDEIDLDPKLRLKLEHIQLSHQGKRIWGAIEEPRFLEAYLVHAADSTDASRFIYSNAKKEAGIQDMPGSENNRVWTDYNRALKREIYLG